MIKIRNKEVSLEEFKAYCDGYERGHKGALKAGMLLAGIPLTIIFGIILIIILI